MPKVGNRYNSKNNTISAAELGLPTEPRKAVITRIDPAAPAAAPAAAPVQSYDWSSSDQPYRATRNEFIDHAKGFRHVAMPLAWAASIALPLTAWVGLGVIGWISVLLAVTGWLAMYLFSYVFSQLIGTHYGVKALQVIFQYRLLRHDQIERHNHYRRMTDDK